MSDEIQYQSEYTDKEGKLFVVNLNEFIFRPDDSDFKVATPDDTGYYLFNFVESKDGSKALMLAKNPDWIIIDPKDPEYQAMIDEIDPELFDRCFGEDYRQ